MPKSRLILVRGAGELATGVVQKLTNSGLRVAMLERPYPTAVRRLTCLSEAVYSKTATVEGMVSRLTDNYRDMEEIQKQGEIPVIVDPEGAAIEQLGPYAVIDATMAPDTSDMRIDMAPITIALGPGYTAPTQVHAVVETTPLKGMGRMILQGGAFVAPSTDDQPDTDRNPQTLFSPVDGVLRAIKNIGDVVHKGEAVLIVDQTFIKAPFTGILRGTLHPGLFVPAGIRVADIDPITDIDPTQISDRSRSVAGGVLEAYFHLHNRLQKKKR